VIGAILVAVAAGASVTPFLISCEDTAEAGETTWEERRQKVRERRAKEAADFRLRWEQREQAWEERRAKQLAEDEARRARWERELAKAPPQKRVRRVRRFRWESPAETRGKVWNVPVEETVESLETALLRVCIAEADGNPQDCAGIWQVIKSNRRRSCDRGMIRRITECVDGEGETYLSAIRRHQRHVLGMIKARNQRATWVRNLTTDCEMPEGWPASRERWDSQYGTKTCPQTVADVRRLLAGKLPESRPGARVRWLPGRPVTWGGRCETGRGACDDRIACARGLARIPGTDTLNAFWCRPGRAGCPEDIDPICIQMGYPSRLKAPEPAETVTAIDPVEEPSDENS